VSHLDSLELANEPLADEGEDARRVVIASLCWRDPSFI
jgi:hypothetical protein